MSSDTDSELARATAAMLSLNDDCLERIFSYLNISEQIQFARICPRLREGFKEYSKHSYKVCDLYEIYRMRLSDVREFFLLAGENIQILTRSKEFRNPNPVLQWLGSFCTQLRQLNLSNCFLNDISIIWLQNLKNLETLTLADNKDLTGMHLDGLVHLTELNLCGCLFIKQESFIGIFKELSDLKKLDIRGCEAMTSEVLTALAIYCRNLEVLKMTSPNFNFDYVALLPRLKELILLDHCSNSSRRTRFFEVLVATKSNQLESLEMYHNDILLGIHFNFISQIRSLKKLAIDFNWNLNDFALERIGNLKQLENLSIEGCQYMSAVGLLNLLRNCPRLNSLNIQYCNKIETEFVLDAIPILHDESAERGKPMKLFVFESKIAQTQLAENAQYLEAVEKSLIKIEFNKTDFLVDDGMYLNEFRAQHLAHSPVRPGRLGLISTVSIMIND